MQHEMDQSRVNGGKRPWLLKMNVAAGLGLPVRGHPQRLALGWAQENGPRKSLAAGMSLLDLGWWDRGGQERIFSKDTLPLDQQGWRKESRERGGRIFLSPQWWGVKGKPDLPPLLEYPIPRI